MTKQDRGANFGADGEGNVVVVLKSMTGNAETVTFRCAEVVSSLPSMPWAGTLARVVIRLPASPVAW